MILKELFLSFQLVNADTFIKGSIAFENYGMIATFIDMFTVALRMSFPIIGTLLIVSVAMGLLAKAAPQMNLLMIGFPISIAVSFVLMIVILPGLILFFEDYIDSMFKNIWFLMNGLKR
jgi:flagellar biosynthetic protein FliR